MTKDTVGIISSVSPGSIASDLAWQSGDLLVSLNGHPLRDVIDYRFYQADDLVEAVVDHGSHRRAYVISKDPDEDLGVEFTEGLFDHLQTCRNDCPFCFLKGLPLGLRRSLYLKDDDYRYSFLFGNFITLTNLKDADWDRIAEQRLSPLYVSVHATDDAVRRRILGNPAAPAILDQLRRLGAAGIRVHTQIVLAPPVNTGEVLRQSVHDLAALYPIVQSIGIVPVGLTRLSAGLRAVTATEAAELVRAHLPWRRRFAASLGPNLVYLADELYLRAGLQVPGNRYYEDYPQLENGIGLTRTLLDDWSRLRRRPTLAGLPARVVTLVCGTLIAPSLATIADQWNALSPAKCRVVTVANDYFGGGVTVSGLLTGRDVIAQTKATDLGDQVVLPGAMFSADQVTLDDLGPRDLESALGRPVALASTMRDVLDAAASCSPGATARANS
jgi:putative radical SAM enzyme (TIGR03279 family)